MTPSTLAALPVFDGDLYADDVLFDPFPSYAALRDLGPLVRLSAHDVVALPRYREVRAALANSEVFCSGQGVALNAIVNDMGGGASILMSDGAQHARLRSSLMRRLTPRALRPVPDLVESAAERIVDDLMRRGSFDAVADLAVALTLDIVPDLIGWPRDGIEDDLLPWAAATFDTLGPANERFTAAGPRFLALGEFARRIVEHGNVLPGSIVADLLAAAIRGEVPWEQCPVAMVDYLAPSLDTTISGISRAIALFAEHPDQWDLIRKNPALIPAAFNEVLRLHSPVTGFTRMTLSDNELGGVMLPAGTRVLILFASANRDERKYPEPDRFDIRRNPGDMLGFGYGIHACAGQGLARLEAHTVLEVLARRVARFHTSVSRPGLNNTIHALAELHTTVTASDDRR